MSAELDIDNGELKKSTSLLEYFGELTDNDRPTNEQVDAIRDDLKSTYDRREKCRSYISEADVQIAALQKALDGWTNFRAHQARRLPILDARYGDLKRLMRQTEDEQDGM